MDQWLIRLAVAICGPTSTKQHCHCAEDSQEQRPRGDAVPQCCVADAWSGGKSKASTGRAPNISETLISTGSRLGRYISFLALAISLLVQFIQASWWFLCLWSLVLLLLKSYIYWYESYGYCLQTPMDRYFVITAPMALWTTTRWGSLVTSCSISHLIIVISRYIYHKWYPICKPSWLTRVPPACMCYLWRLGGRPRDPWKSSARCCLLSWDCRFPCCQQWDVREMPKPNKSLSSGEPKIPATAILDLWTAGIMASVNAMNHPGSGTLCQRTPHILGTSKCKLSTIMISC